jgi:hypothetical protein
MFISRCVKRLLICVLPEITSAGAIEARVDGQLPVASSTGVVRPPSQTKRLTL